jgi:HAD superfamily hydrolase (TIGR01509 family)
MTIRTVITTILFDVGGVLIEPLDKAAVRQRRERLAVRLGFQDADTMWQRFYSGPEWEATKTGRQSQAAMWDQLLSPHGLDTPAAQAEFVTELFAGEGVQPAMRRLLDELHGRYRLAVLSNAGDTLETVLRGFGLDAYFHEIVNSHRIRLAKPDPRAFEVTLNRLQVAPAELFFTDNLARNVEAAEAMGITSHLFTTVAELRLALHRHGLLGQDGRPAD